MIHTVKGFAIVNKAEIDVFLELSCFFHDPINKQISEFRPYTFMFIFIIKPAKYFLKEETFGLLYCKSVAFNMLEVNLGVYGLQR